MQLNGRRLKRRNDFNIDNNVDDDNDNNDDDGTARAGIFD
jgi:hypothetical protein